MARGDHLRVFRCVGMYYHHGIDLGRGRVIHYSGEPLDSSGAEVRIDPIKDFSKGGEIEIVEHTRTLPVNEVIKRARSKLGEREYSLVFNNCEHFARWCKTGEHKSEQVEEIIRRIGEHYLPSVYVVYRLWKSLESGQKEWKQCSVQSAQRSI